MHLAAMPRANLNKSTLQPPCPSIFPSLIKESAMVLSWDSAHSSPSQWPPYLFYSPATNPRSKRPRCLWLPTTHWKSDWLPRRLSRLGRLRLLCWALPQVYTYIRTLLSHFLTQNSRSISMGRIRTVLVWRRCYYTDIPLRNCCHWTQAQGSTGPYIPGGCAHSIWLCGPYSPHVLFPILSDFHQCKSAGWGIYHFHHNDGYE